MPLVAERYPSGNYAGFALVLEGSFVDDNEMHCSCLTLPRLGAVSRPERCRPASSDALLRVLVNVEAFHLINSDRVSTTEPPFGERCRADNIISNIIRVSA